MTSIRPAKPKWQESPKGPVAATALGEFSISQSEDGLWRALLNDAPFPVLYDQIDQAQQAASIMARLAGHPSNVDFEWVPNDAGGISAKAITGAYHVIPSERIEGYFVMDDEAPANIPMSSMEEAKEACYQYIVFVWFSLSEVV